MCDVYVYYFMRPREPAGRSILSERRATLEAIAGKGEAVMESQIVVDESEVDGNGFLISGLDSASQPIDVLWAEIRSLERRANSRDAEALTTSESAEGARRYMLSMESRELRTQILALKKQLSDLRVEELDDERCEPGFAQFPGSLTTE
jgi:hypothetical protein